MRGLRPATIKRMKNFCGQEITIGTIVGGSHSTRSPRIGIVVGLKPGTNGWQREVLKATCIWLQGGTTVKGSSIAEKLLVIDETIDPRILEHLEDAYEDYFLPPSSSGGEIVGAQNG